jgi:hypothetical protein
MRNFAGLSVPVVVPVAERLVLEAGHLNQYSLSAEKQADTQDHVGSIGTTYRLR